MSGTHDEDPPPWQTTPAGAEGAPPAGDAPSWQPPSSEAAREREPAGDAPSSKTAGGREPAAPQWQGPPRGEASPGHWQPPPGWQPGGQPQYGHRMTWQPAPPTPGAATASLLVGITAVILLPLLGPVAVWLGSRAKRRIDASQGAFGGRAVASWGVWLGWIGVLLTLVMAALVAIYFAGD